MRVVLDVEANGLKNPTKVWVVVCKDIDTGEVHVFRRPSDDAEQKEKLKELLSVATLVVGHNILSYDYPVLRDLLSITCAVGNILDTLVLSRLVSFSRDGGHSIEQYGREFGFEKIDVGKSVAGHNPFFDKWSKEMEEYCVRDVDICHRVYNLYLGIISNDLWRPAIELEHQFQLVVDRIAANGFGFNTPRARSLLQEVETELAVLDKEIANAFPPRLRPIREIVPRTTKFGTLNRTDFRWAKGGDLSEYNGGSFTRCEWTEFNPSSHKQIVEVLDAAGWAPTNKTQAHVDLERELNRAKYLREEKRGVDLTSGRARLEILEKYGWKVDETNLSTLPRSAPAPARTLAKRIMLESRRRTLTEWLSLVGEDDRIHGTIQGIGTWTHRTASQKPNMQNIPNEYDTNGKKKLLGKELRALWRVPKNRLLVGVDAEGIQLRIFAHYIDDPEFTRALVEGKKEDKSDPHSLNQRILGNVCKTRQAAKRFVYALLLGGGIGKLAQILEASEHASKDALERLMERYQGFAYLKQHVFPADARRGYFVGLDGRHVQIPGETEGQKRHLAMSGYLQNGEKIVMARATVKWEGCLDDYQALLCNLVHDEWQTETPNNMAITLSVAKMQADSLRLVGEELGLKCPLAGSYWNDDKKDYTIGTNWGVTH